MTKTKDQNGPSETTAEGNRSEVTNKEQPINEDLIGRAISKKIREMAREKAEAKVKSTMQNISQLLKEIGLPRNEFGHRIQFYGPETKVELQEVCYGHRAAIEVLTKRYAEEIVEKLGKD